MAIKLFNDDTIHLQIDKQLFKYSIRSEKYFFSTENDTMFINAHLKNTNLNYAVINSFEVFYDAFLLGEKIYMSANKERLTSIEIHNNDNVSLGYAFNIVNMPAIINSIDEVKKYILSFTKKYGLPFCYASNTDIPYSFKINILDICSCALIIYLLDQAININFNEKNDNIIFKLLNIPPDIAPTDLFYERSRIICDILNFKSMNTPFSNIGEFKYEILSIGGNEAIPIYSTNNIFSFAWIELRHRLTNSFYYYNNEYIYNPNICIDCKRPIISEGLSKSLGEYDNSTNYLNKKNKLCKECKDKRNRNNKNKSYHNLIDLYNKTNELMVKLDTNNRIYSKEISDIMKLKPKKIGIKRLKKIYDDLVKLK